ncbi:RluA family pseudouridine synthase [Treponema sp. C6A8]|uniref:RluA family pseudouridine synthase n=1 Tax=Treponema sp. C6A8 TaxID=1410609 RepID=UPI000482FDC8|nr:RluA family pseudouridine synthase [Treponema sp. C6A8]
MLIKIRVNKNCRLDELLREELPARVAEGVHPATASAASAGIRAPSTPAISNSKIRRLILAGSVSVNGRQCRRPAFELRGHSEVNVDFEPEKFFFEKQPDDIDFVMTDRDVLFEDENLIFVNKPAFLPVEQTITGNRKNLHDAVVDFLWKRNPELRNPPYVGIMHRLDRETSGVILFTKTRAVNKAVHDMFESHNFTKIYKAVVAAGKSGVAQPARPLKAGSSFTVENYLGRVSSKSQAGKWGPVSQKEGGLYAKTTFHICQEIRVEGKKCFLVECELFTGRTHQIRVHLSGAGLPILGDTLYGGVPAKRIYLHAERLSCSEGELSFDVQSPFDLSDSMSCKEIK